MELIRFVILHFESLSFYILNPVLILLKLQHDANQLDII